MATTILLMLEPSPAGGSLKGILLETGDLTFHPELEAAYADSVIELGLHRDASLTDRYQAVTRDHPKHYGVLQSREAFTVHEKWLDRYRDQYNPAVWQRIDRARHWSESEIEDSQTTRQLICDFFELLFEDYDYAVLPATTVPAPGDNEMNDSLRNQLLTLTTPASMAALPVLTVPVFLESGLSGGLQIIYRNPDSDLPLRLLNIWSGV